MRNSLRFAMLLAVLVACERPRPATLYTLGKAAGTNDGAKGPLLSSIETRIDPSVLVPNQRVKIDLHVPGKTIVLDLEPMSPRSLALREGQHAWAARLSGIDSGFFLRIGDFVEGRVQRGERIYRIRSMTPSTGVLETFDAQQFQEAPDDGVVESAASELDAGVPSNSSCQDPPERIDVMVLYTSAARDAAGGEQAIKDEIDFAIAEANQANLDSGVAHLLYAIYRGEVPGGYVEDPEGVDPALLFKQLKFVDGELDAIHGLRSSEGADLASLIFERGNLGIYSPCGYGDQVESASAATKQLAFSVVRRWCVANVLNLAHETGHNIGANHDRANATSNLNYNFGHIQPHPTTPGVAPWRTIMAYDTPCRDDAGSYTCVRVARFSNPGLDLAGDPTGVATTKPEPEHNVKAFASNHEAVSRYHCGSEVGANVWMKDLWEDEGREPDPMTAGQPMWKSPYVWVRQNEDPELEHEYDHENPVQGQTNYVYVKLLNTGAQSESSSLELYFAHASTNLNDPASWTLIDSQARTVAPDADDVAMFEWSSIDSSGHYCLLARWNIDEKPLEFTSLDAAVRADNDLVWRNVNVIDLGGSPQSSAVFAMAGDGRSRETYLLITTQPMSLRAIDWAQMVRGAIEVDPARLDRSKLRVLGLRQTVNGKFEFVLGDEPKMIGPFLLRPGETTEVRLATMADPSTVKNESARLVNPAHYDITVMQISADGAAQAPNPSALFERQGLVIGGVSYTLRLPAGR